MTKGVPQGNVIFNIFVNDLLFVVQCYIYNFADDNTIAEIEKDLELLLRELSDKAGICMQLFDDNSMKANATKFQFMICDRKHRCPEDVHIVVNGYNLTRVTIFKLLGLNIDDQLSFGIHVTGLCKKASKCLVVLLRLSGKVGGTKERLVLLDAFLCSVFTYCPTMWHFCSKRVDKMMEKIYERGLRFVMNDPSRSYEELLMLTKCDTMFLWRLKKIAIFMFLQTLPEIY